MNILDIRIQLETTLADVLGTYRLPNGATTPAIAVRAWGEGFPAGTVVEGLEVVIIKDPEPVELVQYQKQVAFHTWTLFLVDWSGEHALQDISGRLLWAWPGSTAVQIQMPRGVGPKAQMKVELRTNPDFAQNPDNVPVPNRPVSAVRVDTSTSGIIYVGEAIYDAEESSPIWTITRSTYNAAGIRLTKGTATGVTWTGRAGHTYT
jgi:hypothetical protein